MPDITAARPASGAPIETGWGDQMHDAIEGVQAGTVTIPSVTNAVAVQVTVTFPRPFSANPTIVTASSTVGAWVGWQTLTPTSVVLTARRWDSATAISVAAQWIAVGPLA